MKPSRAPLMSVDEFLVWGEAQPDRYELVDGRPHAMSPERVLHAETKLQAAFALSAAIRRASVPCQVFPDGVTIRINAKTAFEPDALVRCGPRLDGDALEIPDPLIVVEVLSPSTRNYDAGAKLVGYFSVPSIQHYLMIDPDHAVVVHHRRNGDAIETRVLGAGARLRLDPPGLDVGVEDLLPAA